MTLSINYLNLFWSVKKMCVIFTYEKTKNHTLSNIWRIKELIKSEVALDLAIYLTPAAFARPQDTEYSVSTFGNFAIS